MGPASQRPVLHWPLAGGVYNKPIVLKKKGAVELRYAPVKADGSLSKQVFGALYVVE